MSSSNGGGTAKYGGSSGSGGHTTQPPVQNSTTIEYCYRCENFGHNPENCVGARWFRPASTYQGLETIPIHAWEIMYGRFDEELNHPEHRWYTVDEQGDSDGTNSDTGKKGITVLVHAAVTGTLLTKVWLGYNPDQFNRRLTVGSIKWHIARWAKMTNKRISDGYSPIDFELCHFQYKSGTPILDEESDLVATFGNTNRISVCIVKVWNYEKGVPREIS